MTGEACFMFFLKIRCDKKCFAHLVEKNAICRKSRNFAYFLNISKSISRERTSKFFFFFLGARMHTISSFLTVHTKYINAYGMRMRVGYRFGYDRARRSACLIFIRKYNMYIFSSCTLSEIPNLSACKYEDRTNSHGRD